MQKSLSAFLLVLVGMLSAQTATKPVTVTCEAGMVTFKNTTGKGILALGAMVHINGAVAGVVHNSPYFHDFYWNKTPLEAGEFTTGDYTSPGSPAPVVSAEVTFIQFEDGSKQGTPNPEFAYRGPMTDAWAKLARVYVASGEAAFLEAIDAIPDTVPERYVKNQVRQLQKEYGTPVAIQNINERLAAATARQAIR